MATRDERDEAAFVVSTIRKALDEGVDAKQIAVFYRIHAQSRVLEEGMRSENVPYQIIGGTRFFDRAEVKDIIAYLRVVANPASDVDLLRIINVPARKIGNATIEKLIETANVTSRSIYEVITGDLRLTGLKAGPRKRVAAFATMMAGFRAFASELGPRAMAERVLEITGYANALARENTAEADARLENLQELLGSLEEYEDEAVAAGTSPSLSDYLERVPLVSDVDQVQNVPRVSMMTIHGAKGLEFEVVLVTGAEEELFPYRSSKVMQEPGQLEEERRLAYVAFTRAREHLFITHAGSRMIFGTTRYTRPSRFLADLPPDVIDQQLSPALGRLRAPMSSPGRLWESQPEEPRYAPGERFVELDENPCPPDDVPLTRGTLVVHRKYGEGRVEAVELSQTPPIAVVFFPGWGKKKIVVSFLQPA